MILYYWQVMVTQLVEYINEHDEDPSLSLVGSTYVPSGSLSSVKKDSLANDLRT